VLLFFFLSCGLSSHPAAAKTSGPASHQYATDGHAAWYVDDAKLSEKSTGTYLAQLWGLGGDGRKGGD